MGAGSFLQQLNLFGPFIGLELCAIQLLLNQVNLKGKELLERFLLADDL